MDLISFIYLKIWHPNIIYSNHTLIHPLKPSRFLRYENQLQPIEQSANVNMTSTQKITDILNCIFTVWPLTLDMICVHSHMSVFSVFKHIYQSSIFYSCFFPILVRRDLLEPIPAVKGREAGYTLDRSPAYRRDNTQRHSLTHLQSM